MKRFVAMILMLLLCSAIACNAESEEGVSQPWYCTGEEYAYQRHEIDTGIPYALGNIQLVLLLYEDGVHWLAYFEQEIPVGRQSAFIELCNELNSQHWEGKFFVSESFFCYSIWVPHEDVSAAALSFDAGRVVWPLDSSNGNIETVLSMSAP